MKRILAFALLCALLILMTACGETLKHPAVFPESLSETVTEDEATAETEETEETEEAEQLNDEPEPGSDSIKETLPPVTSTAAPPATDAKKPVKAATRAPNADELRTLELINQRRAEAGVPALEFDYEKFVCAQVRTEELLVKVAHERPNGQRASTVMADCGIPYYGHFGENIASNCMDVDDAMVRLYDSDSHRTVMLNPVYKKVAVCVELNENGRIRMIQLYTER